MNYFPRPHRIIPVFSFLFLVFGCGAILAAVAAPYLGLGLKEEFLFYRLADLSRSEIFSLGIFSGLAGLMLARKNIMRLINGWPWVADKSQRLQAYFASPSAANSFNRRDQKILLTTAILFQAFHLVALRGVFECDALTFFNYAESLSGQPGAYSYQRGPGFPVFLVLTGQTFFNTFAGTVFAHAIIGILSPLMAYRALSPINRILGLSAAGLLIVSSLPFAYVKAMLPQQFFMFLVVCSIYFFSRYFFTKQHKFIYLTILFSFFAAMTRGEALLLPFILGGGILLLMRREKLLWGEKGQGLHFIFSLALVLGMFATYSGARSVHLNDLSLFGGLNNWSGRQLFLQPYYVRTGRLFAYRNILGTSQEKKPQISLIQPDNGPASRRFHELLVEIYSDPQPYRALEPLLSMEVSNREAGVAHFDDAGTDKVVTVYDLLFGQFDGRPKDLARNFFQSPNMTYFDHVWRELDNKIGISQADKLMRDVAMEAIARNPDIFIVFAHTALNYFGIDSLVTLRMLTGSIPFETHRIFGPLSSFPSYALRSTFNGSGCASLLPANMPAEYKWDYFAGRPPLFEKILHNMQTTVRNFLRNAVGAVALLSWWALFFSRQRIFFVVMALSVLSMVAGLSLANGMSLRYEPGVQPLIIMATCAAVYTVLQLLRRAITRALKTP
ncbi:MAG: hypothetical protein ISR48_00435 [Alphaproteobacteria bacterium]|nr:hypothetical protein [Alphaproteobacteria bacterium]